MSSLEDKLQTAIEEAEQVLVVCTHAGAKVPETVVQCAERLRALLAVTHATDHRVGVRRAGKATSHV